VITQNSSTPSTATLLRTAQEHFGIKRFRPGQKEVLESVFTGNNTLAIMPTGGGKSLTYQLPALLLPHPVVVVSPLISLMQDQQEKAQQSDVVVEKLDSTVRKQDRERAEEEIAGGSAQLIYVTPEKLESQDFRSELIAGGGISLLVVDEAHTIAQWGHDFRPAFLGIGEARKALGNPPVLALTATATPQVAEEILKSLHAEDATRIHTGIERPNLSFSVIPTVNNDAKLARIVSMVEKESGTGIVYTASVRSANDLYEHLSDRGISVGHYHGKMKPTERERVQQEFMRGDHKVMIATKAFGLGIDKPDIRFVYHFEFPDSLETYYQEAGRAGRDGEPATATLLYRLEDKRIQSFFLAGRYPKPEELERVYLALKEGIGSLIAIAEHASIGQRRTSVVLNLLRESNLIRRSRNGYSLAHSEPPSSEQLQALLQTYVDRAANDKNRLTEMMHYAETLDCRVQVIRAYFEEPEEDPCHRCDNCIRQRDAAETHADIQSPDPSAAHVNDQVTTIETIHGTIRTTAPETLLRPANESSFHEGDTVSHKRFGLGKVLDIHGDKILVAFDSAGQKRLRADFLSAT
jgi:ATP-dependent DNA helicase RecQ